MVQSVSSKPVPLFELVTQYQSLRPEVEAAIREVMEATDYIGGRTVERFERHLGAFHGAQAVAISSGTDAILACLMAMGIGAGDEVVTTPFTFFATAGCVSRTGAKPVFVDIDPETFLMLEGEVGGALTAKTKAIMPVHLFGQMADTAALAAVACKHDLPVIEDAAQCIGARDEHGKGIGENARAACLSFYPTKNLGAAGDAGALITRDPQLATRFKQTRQHGETARYYHEFVGGNFRLDAIQCAVLDVKLRHLVKWNEQRRAIAAYYTERFEGSDVVAPKVKAGGYHVFHQYVVRVPRRDAAREFLTAQGIGSNVYYPKPLHLQACFADLGYKAGAFPNAERASGEVLALPIFPELSEGQFVRVAETLLSFYR